MKNYESVVDRQIELLDVDGKFLGLLEFSYESSSEYFPATFHEPSDFEFSANIFDIKLFIGESETALNVSENEYPKLLDNVTNIVHSQNDKDSIIIDLSYFD
jgi:hypothetical protein